MKIAAHTKLSLAERTQLLNTLNARFQSNMHRHKKLLWEDVEKKLTASPKKLWSLSEMERTGGEPDVVMFDTKTGEYIFCDCSKETPQGRRSVCFDRDGLASRKEHAPEHNALDMAAEMGIKILSEDEYRELQKIETVDTKTSSWIETPAAIRKLGGALFADYRYDTVFVYHNGAQSYYAVRGFRGLLRI